MMKTLRLISGGAAQGLVSKLRDQLAAQHGVAVEGSFGAVGMMKDKLLAGTPCDVVILTDALIRELAAQGHVVADSITALGVVRTGVAVKSGSPLPAIDTSASLANVFRASSGIYFPDPVKATAGIHVMKVLKALGLDQELAGKLRPYPNGATAMREMAQADRDDVVGSTQVTEILYTPGVQLVGVLPKEFELATVYTAAVCSKAADPQGAAALVGLLAGDGAKAVREAGGFELS
jgi:molybdate transport system substrate-binding protein